MKLGDGVSLRRSGLCAAVGVVMTVGLLAANGATAAPVATRPGAARAPQPAARWHLPHLASWAGINARQRSGSGAGWRVIYTASTSSWLGLWGVTALNPHDAWAVGYATGTTLAHDHAVVLHWINGRWRHVPIPGAHLLFLQYVAASSPRDVWVFGFRSTASGEPWQALRWDGQTWHQVPQPPVPGVLNEVGFLVLGPSSVWFPSQSSCTAGACSTPVCRWNGRSWVTYHLNGTVTSLAASAPTNIWAAGLHRVGGIARPVADRWNGTAWRRIAMPSHAVTGTQNGGPVIDTSSPRAVWIGSESDNFSSAFLLHWNGQRWRELRSFFDGGTAVIDWPIGIWASPWSFFNGRNFGGVNDPPRMNRVNYLARVPRSDAMLAVGGQIRPGSSFRTEIFAYGRFG